jgi:hypothetical protein
VALLRELHGAGTEPQGFKRDRVDHTSGKSMVYVVFPVTFSIPESPGQRAAVWPGDRTQVQSDLRHVCSYVTGSWERIGECIGSLRVYRKSQHMWGGVEFAGRKPGEPLLAAGEATAAEESSQLFISVGMVALHATTEPIATEGTRDFGMFHGVATRSRCPSIAEGRGCADTQTDVCHVLQ